MSRAPRYWFPDEEPEPDSPAFDYGYAATADLCGRCGQRGHRYEASRAECPNYPLMIRAEPSKPRQHRRRRVVPD